MPKTTTKPKTQSSKAPPKLKSAAKKSVAKKPAQPKKAATKKTATKKNVSKKAMPKSKSTNNKVAAKSKSPTSRLGKDFIDSQLEKLKLERSKYETSAEQLEEEAENLLNNRGTDIQMAEESGEGDTTSYYRELDLALSAQSREVVEQIDEAIERIKKGTYGICVDTGKPIPKKRLEAIPWASQTVEAKAGGLRHR